MAQQGDATRRAGVGERGLGLNFVINTHVSSQFPGRCGLCHASHAHVGVFVVFGLLGRPHSIHYETQSLSYIECAVAIMQKGKQE